METFLHLRFIFKNIWLLVTFILNPLSTNPTKWSNTLKYVFYMLISNSMKVNKTVICGKWHILDL